MDDHIDHALAFTNGAEPPAVAVDLGAGGGVPGLVLALHWHQAAWHLVESMRRRATLLERAVADLGLGARVTVWCERGEVVGRGPLRAACDLVVARSFGPPPVVAECAAPLLRIDGRLLVSEPPTDNPARWPADGLAALGLLDEGATESPRIRRLRQAVPCSDRYPRRPGIPEKRPLWDVPRGTSSA